MKGQPYIGITGLCSDSEASILRDQAVAAGFGWKHDYKLMLGYLTSTKRIADPASGGSKSPPLQYLRDALPGDLTSDSWILPAIHHHSLDPGKLYDELSTIFGLVYDRCKTVQINNRWPQVEVLEKLRTQFPELTYIIQLPSKVLDEPITDIRQKLCAYEGIASYALIDPSGGVGKDMDLERTIGFVQALSDVDIQLGIAGGLCSANVRSVITAVGPHYARKLCVDAEGKLRNERGFLDNDRGLNYEECGKYLKASAGY